MLVWLVIIYNLAICDSYTVTINKHARFNVFLQYIWDIFFARYKMNAYFPCVTNFVNTTFFSNAII